MAEALSQVPAEAVNFVAPKPSGRLASAKAALSRVGDGIDDVLGVGDGKMRTIMMGGAAGVGIANPDSLPVLILGGAGIAIVSTFLYLIRRNRLGVGQIGVEPQDQNGGGGFGARTKVPASHWLNAEPVDHSRATNR